MKKKLIIFLFMIINLMFHMIEVNAEINVNAAGGQVSGSSFCKTEVCSNTVGIANNIKNEPVDGMRVILMDGNTQLGQADLWFTYNKQTFAGGSANISSIFNKYYLYQSPDGTAEKEVFNYANMLLEIKRQNDTATIETLLKSINQSYTISNTKNYYLVIEPIFVLRYQYSGKIYYFSGTPKEVVNGLINLNNVPPKHMAYAKFFAYKDRPNCNDNTASVDWDGKVYTSNGECQNWNVIRNYFTSFQLNSTYGPFTNTGGQYTNEWAASYESNIYGKGILQISDFITSGNLKIYKYKTGTTTPITSGQVIIGFYDNPLCLGKPYKNVPFTGQSPLIELKEGTYYIREDAKPSQYYIGDNTCHTVVIKSGETTPYVIENTPTCESDFEELIAAGQQYNRQKRLDLFLNKYPNSFQLLNFNVTDPVSACSNTRDCGNTQSYTCEGISLNYNGFSKDNLSCYMEKDDNGNFCTTNVSLDTSFLKYYESISPFKSGRIIFLYKAGTLENQLPGLKLTRICYNVNGNNVDSNLSIMPNSDISHYITDLKVLGKNSDNEEKMSERLSIREGFEPIITYPDGSDSLSVEKNFLLTRKACIAKMSGKVVNDTYCTGNYEGNYIYAEGLVPKFTIDGDLYVYPYLQLSNYFKDPSGNTINLSISQDNRCLYRLDGEIIPPAESNKLNLTFRIIDTTNPFPGVFGNGRVIGSNWCDGENTCMIEDSLYINEKIINAPNSKGIKIEDGTAHASSPKYEIVLNSNVIKEIREYNDSHTYDEHDINYVGGSYQNSFLRDYQGYFKIFPSN